MALFEFWGTQQFRGSGEAQKGEDAGQGRYKTTRVRFWGVKGHLGVWAQEAGEQAGQ